MLLSVYTLVFHSTKDACTVCGPRSTGKLFLPVHGGAVVKLKACVCPRPLVKLLRQTAADSIKTEVVCLIWGGVPLGGHQRTFGGVRLGPGQPPWGGREGAPPCSTPGPSPGCRPQRWPQPWPPYPEPQPRSQPQVAGRAADGVRGRGHEVKSLGPTALK